MHPAFMPTGWNSMQQGHDDTVMWIMWSSNLLLLCWAYFYWLGISVLCECNCHILRLLPHFSAKCAYRIYFQQKLAFLMAILILFVFLLPISIRFRYLDHLVAPSMCLDPCGRRWGSWFQAILYHISASYLVFMQSAYFFKMPHKTGMPNWCSHLSGWHRIC